jgi:hypothetical protein
VILFCKVLADLYLLAILRECCAYQKADAEMCKGWRKMEEDRLQTSRTLKSVRTVAG